MESATQRDWKNVETKFTKIHNFKKDTEFIGRFIEAITVEKLDGQTFNKFQCEDGTERLLPNSYLIADAIERYGKSDSEGNVILYRFKFTGTTVKGNKKFSDFDVQVSSELPL